MKTQHLRQVRRARGFTQDTLSLVSGISQATLSRIENGRPILADERRRISRVLGVKETVL